MNDILTLKLKAHFLNLYKLVLSDNTIELSELALLYKIGLERGISKDEINAIILSPGTADKIPESVEERVEYLYDLTRLAWADGVIKTEEIELIKSLCLKYEFQEEYVDNIVSFFLQEVQNGTSAEQLLAKIKHFI